MDLFLSIFKLFLTKRVWDRFGDTLDKEYLRRNFPELLRIYNAFPKIHEVVEQQQASIIDAQAVFYGLYPQCDREVYTPLFERIAASEANDQAIELYLSTLASRMAATKLAFVSLDHAEGRATYEAYEAELKACQAADRNESSGVDDGQFVSDDIEVLYNAAVKEGGLNWRLQALRRSLGPLRKGDFGFVFARPETGKTTFLASEVTYMAGFAEAPVLWFNNEEQGEKVGLRCYQAALNAPLERILGDFPRAKEEYLKRLKGNLRIRDDSGISRRGIEKLCRIYQPALIVVDQLDKVRGFDADREDLVLGAIYQWARELAKEYAPVIGVSQADGSAEGVKYLNMGNVANAKTAKQAEADWILGIGQDWNDPPQLRGFSICKNKLIGGDESVPGLRHGKFEIVIEPELARYKDTI